MESMNERERLEEMVFALPTPEYVIWHSLSGFPKLERVYLRILEKKYQRLLKKSIPEYQNTKFIFK